MAYSSLADPEDVHHLHRHGPVAAISTVNEPAMNPAESGKLAARHNRVEIAEACWGEAKYSNWMAENPASVQPVEAVAARLLARPILQEYDAFTAAIPGK